MKNPTTKTSLRICAGFLVISAFALSAQAQIIGFDGGTSNPGDWNDPVNWTGDVVPSAANPQTDIGVSAAFGAPGSALVATANITGPLTTSAIGELRIGRGDGAVGVVNHSAGSLTTGGGNWNFIGVDAAGTAASGTYNLSGTASVSGGDRWYVGSGGGAGLSTGIINVSDAASATFPALIVGHNDGNSGTINQTGGTVAYNSWMTVGEGGGATGTYDISGGLLQQNNDWLTVGENATGTLKVSGTADVDLLAFGLTLGRRDAGTGTISIDGSSATIDTTQLFAGIDTDSLAGSGTATLDFTADAGGVSPILASGDVRLNDGTGLGSSALTVDMSLAPAGDILLVDVGGTLTGTFAGLANGAAVAGSGGRFISYTSGDGNDIWLTTIAVPEPTTMALVLLGAATVLTLRRKS